MVVATVNVRAVGGATVIPPDIVALIVVVPRPAAVASPAALMVAVPVVDELHVALLVKFCVEPSV
jgi:hypothetical protein